MDQLSPGISRFAALGLSLLIVFGLVFYGLVPMVKAYTERADQVSMQTRRLATMRNLLANQNAVEDELGRLKTLNDEGEIFFKGAKPAIASAKLRELVSDMVKASGGELVSSQEYQTESLNTASDGIGGAELFQPHVIEVDVRHPPIIGPARSVIRAEEIVSP